MAWRRTRTTNSDIEERIAEATGPAGHLGASLPPPTGLPIGWGSDADVPATTAAVAPAAKGTAHAVAAARTLGLDLSRAVVATMDVRGDTASLLAAYDEYERDHPQRPLGLVVHLCVPAVSGITVIDVWESDVSLEAWLLRTPGQPRPDVRRVHAARIAAA